MRLRGRDTTVHVERAYSSKQMKGTLEPQPQKGNSQVKRNRKSPETSQEKIQTQTRQRNTAKTMRNTKCHQV